MHHLVVIVSSYGPYWRHFPLVATQGADKIFLFADHRNPVARRQAAVAEHVAISDIATLEVFYTSPAPGCEQGTHPWEPVDNADGPIVTVRCPRCGQTDELPEPYPGEVCTLRLLLAPTG